MLWLEWGVPHSFFSKQPGLGGRIHGLNRVAGAAPERPGTGGNRDLKGMEEKVFALLEPLVGLAGFELAWVELAGSPRRYILRLFIDRQGGVTVEDCALISRRVDPALEESNLLVGPFVLEVSSPGLERPLLKGADYERFAGRRAKLRLSGPVEGHRSYVGTLRELRRDSRVALELDDGTVVEIPLEKIHKAHLVFQWE